MKTRRLVLIGPGHGHLFVLEALARNRPAHLEVFLISLGPEQLYSGMVTGWLAGQYAVPELSFHLAGICRAAGAKLLTNGAQEIRADSKQVKLSDGQLLEYDAASLDIGSLSKGDGTPGVKEKWTLGLKPIHRALELRHAIETQGDVLIVGGGTAGVELALCLSVRVRGKVVLVERGGAVPAGGSPRLTRLVGRLLQEREVKVRTGEEVERLESGTAFLTSGAQVSFEKAIWATGPRAPELLRNSGAALDEDGFLAVADTLQSTSHENLFAAGDCAGFISGQRVPKAGVFAVRQGPVLAHNLLAHVSGRPLRRYRAQKAFLVLMNAGDGTAVGTWSGWAWHSRAMGWLKNRIDRRFMERFNPRGRTD